jgi:SAM-dependent methyltransferase
VYTVTQRPRVPLTPPASAPNFRGPKNHRHLCVDRLYRLPFPDNHFDVVSTRTLFLILPADEYDRVLEECLRVLKPGGYFEWQLFDSDLINAGPQAEALAARFAETLKSIGRDPEPTKRWISRIHAAGFEECRRAWQFLPLAPPVTKPAVPAKDDDVAEQVRRKMQTWEEDGGVMGSTKDVAPVAGLLGGWVWEKWLRAAGIEEEGAVGAVVEEAKEWGSGLRSLVGYARKPMA